MRAVESIISREPGPAGSRTRRSGARGNLDMSIIGHQTKISRTCQRTVQNTIVELIMEAVAPIRTSGFPSQNDYMSSHRNVSTPKIAPKVWGMGRKNVGNQKGEPETQATSDGNGE